MQAKLLERLGSVLERPWHVLERPGHVLERPGHVLERPGHVPTTTQLYPGSTPARGDVLGRDMGRKVSQLCYFGGRRAIVQLWLVARTGASKAPKNLQTQTAKKTTTKNS